MNFNSYLKDSSSANIDETHMDDYQVWFTILYLHIKEKIKSNHITEKLQTLNEDWLRYVMRELEDSVVVTYILQKETN